MRRFRGATYCGLALASMVSVAARPAWGRDCPQPCGADNLSFETGDFTGWDTLDPASASFPLQIGAAGITPPESELFTSAPTEGTFACLHGFDVSGGAAGVIRIAQDFAVPADTNALQFDFRAGWLAQEPGARTFSVIIEPAGGGVALQSDLILTAPASSSNLDTGELVGTVDLSTFTGTTIRVAFEWVIPPHVFGSPNSSFFQLDNIRCADQTETDSDGDGVCDIDDLCPGFDDNVIADSDGDGVPDPCDNCPSDANANQADCDEDGKGDVCELASCPQSPWCEDCNGNGIPDGCDDALIRRNATFPTRRTVDRNFDAARSVFAADVDGDGDTDVLGASSNADGIVWWENTEGDGTAWTKRIVDGKFHFATSVFAADVDGDGDTDVLGAAFNADGIAWWENTAGDGTAWTKRTMDGNLDGVFSVFAADVDGDGDTDVLGAKVNVDHITWWENTAGDGTAWTSRTVDGNFAGAVSVFAADVDGDGDTDVLGAAFDADDITWWENTAGDGTAWTSHTVDGNFDGALSVFAADVDGDGDTDVLGAARTANNIAWWENTAEDGTAWTRRTVDGNFGGAGSVFAADVDGDGDIDILGAALDADDITWWENTAGDGTAWIKRTVKGNFDFASSVFAADVDGDGDTDVLGAAFSADDITWWENRGGQFRLTTTGTAPPVWSEGQSDDVLQIVATHNGRAGDNDLELTRLTLLLEKKLGDPLTTAEAEARIESLSVYLDDGSGDFDMAVDTLLTTIDTLALVDGVQLVDFADGDPLAQAAFGTPASFFVVVELTADAADAGPLVALFDITHLAESSEADDSVVDCSLTQDFPGIDVTATVSLPDADADGIHDEADNCPADANGPLAGPNNQLDTDSDGVGDACDACAGGAASGDTDANGNVDLDDYVDLEKCLAGLGAGLGTGCECFDSDSDNDVDLENYAAFQRIFTEP